MRIVKEASRHRFAGQTTGFKYTATGNDREELFRLRDVERGSPVSGMGSKGTD
jgi:hypothetical protein